MADGADERLVVMLEARISEFEKRMAKAERTGTGSYNRLRRGSSSATRQMEADMLRSTGRINQALAATSTQIGSFAKSFAVGFAGGAVATALASFTSNLAETVKGIAQIGDEAKRAGMSTDAFQEWKFVAEQNRIGIDALVDGFKELSLRADEFVVTGAGSAAEAFQRLGYTAADLKEKLKDPSALMLDIIGRLEGLDKAAQIRIANEVFGGTAGEQFVQLLEQGENGIARTIDRARELGIVMDKDMIAKAQELDRRWNELTVTVGNWFKGFAVGAADALAVLVGMRTELDTLLGDEGRARTILGNEVYEDLKKNQTAVNENADAIRQMDAAYDQLTEQAHAMAMELLAAADQADLLGNDALWAVLAQAGTDMNDLVTQFHNGEISGQDLATALQGIQAKAKTAFDELGRADQVSFTPAISAIDALGGKIGEVIGLAKSLYQWLSAAANFGPGQTTGTPLSGSADGLMPPDPNTQVTTSLRPKSAPSGIGGVDWGTDDSGGGRKGGGGGGKTKDEYTATTAAIREEIAALEAETAAFLAVAASGEGYGDAVEYARKRAELRNAAMKQGKAITPELAAEIDTLARSYVTAGLEAEEAAAKLERLREQGQRGVDAISDVFTSVLDGSRSAKEALADLLMQMAKVQMQKAVLGLFGGTGFASAISGLLSFDGGGYTGNGARSGGLDGKGGFLAINHPRETITDHTKGQSIAPAAGGNFSVTVTMDESTGKLGAFVRDQAGRVVSQAAPGIVRQSVGATYDRAREYPLPGSRR